MRKEYEWVCLISEGPNSELGALGLYCFQRKKKKKKTQVLSLNFWKMLGTQNEFHNFCHNSTYGKL